MWRNELGVYQEGRESGTSRRSGEKRNAGNPNVLKGGGGESGGRRSLINKQTMNPTTEHQNGQEFNRRKTLIHRASFGSNKGGGQLPVALRRRTVKEA